MLSVNFKMIGKVFSFKNLKIAKYFSDTVIYVK